MSNLLFITGQFVHLEYPISDETPTNLFLCYYKRKKHYVADDDEHATHC